MELATLRRPRLRGPRPAEMAVPLRRVGRSPAWVALALTLLAAHYRFGGLGASRENYFYDAAVRSMGMSWHNFFYGAFDPSARLAVDKPPLDLWLQVASVKLFGWSSTSLVLPAAIAGTLAVPLLYDLVRRLLVASPGWARGRRSRCCPCRSWPRAVRLTARRRRSRAAESELALTPGALDPLLELPLRAEAALIRRGLSLPAGLSIVATFARPPARVRRLSLVTERPPVANTA